MERSGSARFMSRMTPYLISLNDLNDLNKFFVSLGNLSALAYDIWV